MKQERLPKGFRRPISFAFAEYVAFVGEPIALHPPFSTVWIRLSRLLMRLKPHAHGSLVHNSASPTRCAEFLQFVCDKGLAEKGARSATVFDLGGTGQIRIDMDKKGRIASAADINRDSLVAAEYRNIDDVPSCSADLIISSGMIEYNDDAAVVDILKSAKRALINGAYLVLCQVEKSRFQKYNSYLLRRSSLMFSNIFRFPVRLRPADEVVALLRAAEFHDIEVMPRRYTQPFGAGRAYIVFAR